MKNLGYTIIKNERNEIAVVVNPFSFDLKEISYNKKDNSLYIKSGDSDIATLNNLFKNIDGTLNFLLVEYGPLGVNKETILTF